MPRPPSPMTKVKRPWPALACGAAGQGRPRPPDAGALSLVAQARAPSVPGHEAAAALEEVVLAVPPGDHEGEEIEDLLARELVQETLGHHGCSRLRLLHDIGTLKLDRLGIRD